MTPADVGTLACPACRGPLAFEGALAGGELDSGALRCARCARAWPVRDGLPRLVDEARVHRADRFMRVLYDWLAPLHDPITRALFPPLQGTSELAARDRYMTRLALGSLRPSPTAARSAFSRSASGRARTCPCSSAICLATSTWSCGDSI